HPRGRPVGGGQGRDHGQLLRRGRSLLLVPLLAAEGGRFGGRALGARGGHPRQGLRRPPELPARLPGGGGRRGSRGRGDPGVHPRLVRRAPRRTPQGPGGRQALSRAFLVALRTICDHHPNMSWWEEELAELEAWREEEAALSDPALRLLCGCRGLEEGEVVAVVGAGLDFDEIVARTGATRGCGGYRNVLRTMVQGRSS